MRTYDVHAHCAPDGLLETLRADGARYGVEIMDAGGRPSLRFAGGVTTPPLHPDIGDVEHRIRTMDAGRVDVQLVSSWVDLTAYSLPAHHASRYSTMFNDALAATVARHPERLLALCTAPLQDAPAAVAELSRAVSELGMVGVEIATTVDGRELDDRDLDPFWGRAEELRCMVLIHPYRSLAGRNVKRYVLNNLVGNPAESTIAMAHLVFGGVLERFPGLQLCMVHGGGFVPWQSGRWDRGYEALAAKTAGSLTRPPMESLRRVHFDTVLHDPVLIRFLIDWAGPDRVVLGSDYPFAMGDMTPVDTLDAVDGLDDATRAAILNGNVVRIIDGIQR